jgi:hypothetical protein
MWGCRAWLSGTYLAMRQMKKAPTAVLLLVRGLSVSVGDTGFEPVTSSMSVIFGTHDDAAAAAREAVACPD